MRGAERRVPAQRLLARALTAQHGSQLAPACDAEVERRADALAREREAVAGRVAHEEDAVLRRPAQAVREPVALVAHRGPPEAPGQFHGRLAHVVARLVRAHPDALLAARGDAPPVAVAHQRALDPDIEVGAAALRVDLEP